MSYQGDPELGRASMGRGVVNARNPFYDDWYARLFEGFPLGGCKYFLTGFNLSSGKKPGLGVLLFLDQQELLISSHDHPYVKECRHWAMFRHVLPSRLPRVAQRAAKGKESSFAGPFNPLARGIPGEKHFS